jgi:hypothetical protein
MNQEYGPSSPRFPGDLTTDIDYFDQIIRSYERKKETPFMDLDTDPGTDGSDNDSDIDNTSSMDDFSWHLGSSSEVDESRHAYPIDFDVAAESDYRDNQASSKTFNEIGFCASPSDEDEDSDESDTVFLLQVGEGHAMGTRPRFSHFPIHIDLFGADDDIQMEIEGVENDLDDLLRGHDIRIDPYMDDPLPPNLTIQPSQDHRDPPEEETKLAPSFVPLIALDFVLDPGGGEGVCPALGEAISTDPGRACGTKIDPDPIHPPPSFLLFDDNDFSSSESDSEYIADMEMDAASNSDLLSSRLIPEFLSQEGLSQMPQWGRGIAVGFEDSDMLVMD